jgi:hypothetical protein
VCTSVCKVRLSIGSWKVKNWLPSLNVFRTFLTMPPPGGRLSLAQVQDFVAASGVPL